MNSNELEPIYVVDTHTLLWYLTGSEALSDHVAEVFEAAEEGLTQVIISAIVLAELHYLNKKQQQPFDFATIYKRLAESPAFQLLSFEPVQVLDFDQDATVTEIHDRIIAGIARRLDSPLLTLDKVIASSGVARVEW